MFNLTLALNGGEDGTPFIRIRRPSADRTVQIARILYLGVMLLNTGPATKRKICAIVKGLHRYWSYTSPPHPQVCKQGLSGTAIHISSLPSVLRNAAS